jgi:probable phosphomutase (TIGR03848 family)
MTTIFLVRHGATAQTGQKLSGWTPGVPLTEEGTAQASSIADVLASAPLTAVYSSPIDRAVQTARLIAARHDLRVTVSRAVAEVDFGKWSGRSFKVLRRTRLWNTVQRFPSGVRFPEGESFVEVQTRTVSEIERIRVDHPKEAVCVVSHADVIKLILAHYLGVHLDHFQRILISPGSLSTIAVSAEGPMVLGVNAIPNGTVTRS